MRKSVLQTTRIALASFGFTGYCPIASGTAGSAGAFALLLLLWYLLPEPYYPLVTGALAGVLTITGILLGPWAVKHYQSKDPKPFVLDEAAAFFIAVGIMPKPGIPAIVAAFFVFRFLDIVKPFPARRAEHLPHGFGIMLDDTIVGIFTHVGLRIFSLF